MSHAEKVSKMVADLESRGVGKFTSAPPAFQLAWKLGLTIPPPLFLSFTAISSVMGIFFGVLWGAFMWFAMWRQQAMRVDAAIGASLFAGLLFGVAMALYFRRKARQLGLPAWRDYGKRANQSPEPTPGSVTSRAKEPRPE